MEGMASVPRKRRRLNSIAPSSLAAPQSIFWSLSLHIAQETSNLTSNITPENQPNTALTPPLLPATESPPPSSLYDVAVSRVSDLSSHLTPSMSATLTSLLSTIHLHLSPPDTSIHPFIRLIASDETSNNKLVELAATIDAGLAAFAARGRRSAESPSTSVPIFQSSASRSSRSGTSARSQKVRNRCGVRDKNTCKLTGIPEAGVVAHILPFSMRGGKEADFWRFIAIFRGEEETERLKVIALGDTGGQTDSVRNVWWLSHAAHHWFDKGMIAIIPELTESQYPFTLETVTEYNATVEFPFGRRQVVLGVTEFVNSVPQHVRYLQPGDKVVLQTPDPAELPLPHPLLFQLHLICSRIIAMKAAAGFPVLQSFPSQHDGESLEIESASQQDERESGSLQTDGPGQYPSSQSTSHGPYIIPPISPVSTESCSGCDLRKEHHTVGVQALESLDCVSLADTNAPQVNDDHCLESYILEKPRFVSVVQRDLKRRMNDMWQMCEDRLGRELAGTKWWEEERDQ